MSPVWVNGKYDRDDGNFVWDYNRQDVIASNLWMNGQPNNYEGTQNCVMASSVSLDGDSFLNDYHCAYDSAVICQAGWFIFFIFNDKILTQG